MRGSPSSRVRVPHRTASVRLSAGLIKFLASLLLVCGAVPSSPVSAQVAGQNVNMVSGTGWTNGDPFLERQNEPSIAVSTRNSSHLFGAANDYRSVDLPGLLGIDERGDAWLGVYKSFDGGLTWQSTLLPGYPLDSSPEGAASPIHGRQAAADPLVRAGSNGLFFLSGIAFDRGSGPLSKVFISRYIDLNNKENGDAANENGAQTNLAPRDSVKYVDTRVIDSGSSTRFLDKPWMAVDIPRGQATCTIKANEDGNIVTQKIPAGAIYVTYTAFTTVGKVQNSQILFRRSTDCGATWGRAITLSQSDEGATQPDAEGQGTVIAIDPTVSPNFPATIYVAWRVFAQPGDPEEPSRIRIAKSTDGGLSFTQQQTVVQFPLSCNTKPTGAGCPFDQGETGTSFRSNGYPALTVDNAGRLYVAWSQRDRNGDGRIMMTVSNEWDLWPSSNFTQIDSGSVLDDYGNPFPNLSNRGSQLMPALNFNAGKLILTYYDLRQDHTSGSLTPAAEPACDPAITPLCPLGNPFSEIRQFEDDLLTNPGAVFNAYVDDGTLTMRRHTLDIMGAEAVPATASSSLVLPSFTHFRVSRYEYGIIPPGASVQQAQFNAPNLPMFVQGTAPFMGDYIDVAGAPSMVPIGDSGWRFNTNPAANPVFHAVWTDNRDVLPPPDGISWNKYTPPISSSIGATSKFDPTQTPPACVPGFSGMRNQNIYTSRISHGLILTSPQTAKPVLQSNGKPIPRQFVVIMRNDTNLSHTFQLTIPAQPASAQASFLQFSLQTTLTVNIPALSSASRPVFLTPKAGSTVSFPSFQVNAVETDGGQPPLTASILFNADPTNPFLANPDNAAFGSGSITSQEFYNPAILNPAILNPAILNPAILNPAILNPAILNPAILNPAILNPAILNPNFVVALNPAILNPAILNPAILNNAVANPAILNPAILNTPVSDANYTITNEGNTSATYQLQLFQSGALPASAVFQIILTKTYLTPGVSPTDGCTYGGQVNNEVLASIDNPAFVTNPAQLGNPAILNSAINNPTFSMAPGDTVQVTLRANLTVSDLVNFVLPNLSPVVAAHGVNTVAVQQGVTTPPISLLITTTTLPFAVTGQPYSAPLTALGGNPPLSADIWSLIGGSLPPGLNLSSAGVISGTATATGTFSFVVQVTDTGTPQHIATRSLSINVFAPVVIQTTALPTAGLGAQYTQVFAAIGGLGPYLWTSPGPLPPGLTLSSGGTISGVPTTPGTYTFSVTATDTLGLFATASFTILVSNSPPPPAQIAFVVQPSNAVGSQAISPAVQVQVFDATGAVIPNAQVAMNFGTAACSTATLSGSPLATTNASGIASFSNLIIDRGQLGYTLLATAGNATAVSNSFTVNGFCPTKGPVGIPRQNHTATTLANGTVLIAGGGSRLAGVSSPGLPFSSAELYDPATGTFSATGNMNVPRWGHTATRLLDGRVLLTGGVNSSSTAAGTVTNTAEIYDPSTNTFTPTLGVMNSARYLHTATLLADGRVLVAGGGTSTPPAAILTFGLTGTNTAEIFDPATGVFTPTSTPMATPRQLFTATLLPNGQVLITGGFTSTNAFTVLSSAEIFDPVSNAFHLTGPMTVPRDLHVAALLPSGKVLIAGFDPTTELYDPVSGTFAPTGNLSIAVAGSSAALLPDGTVILPGGLPPGPTTVATSSDQIYTPGTGTFALTGNLVTPTSLYALALLQDGTVLVTGGEGGINGAGTLADSEIYYSTAPLAPLAITTTAVANATQAAPYTQLLLERGGVGTPTWTLASGTLPPGITLSASGILTGTPTAPGTFNFTVQVVDSSKPQKTATSGTLTIIVAGVPLHFTSSAMPTAGSGRFYSQPLPIVGGTPPYAITQTGGTLPPGLSLSSNGVLAGTPSAAGIFTFTVNALDSSVPQQTATQTLTIAINTLFITTTVLPNGIVGVPYNAPIATAGGTLPLSFSLTTAAFPPGLLIQQPGPFSSSGALAGTPTQAGTFVFSESVVDSSNPAQTATQNYFVTIAPAGSPVPANITFVSQPQNSVGGQRISGGAIVVAVTDASNNPIPGTTVALSLAGFFNPAPPCSAAVLSGTLTALTNATGQATFSNLSIDHGGFNYTLLATTGSASQQSAPFSEQGFCGSGNLSTQREFHTQVLLGTAQSIVKFPLDPKGAYLFTNTNPAPPGIPDIPNAPLIIPLASLGLAPGSVISGVPVGDLNPCGFTGESCFGEIFVPFTCGVFSSSNTLLPSGGTINRVPGAIAPNFNTAIPCVTGPTVFGSLPTDIPQDFGFFGEQVTVPPGAVYLFVAFADTLYSDNVDPNGDFGLQLTISSPATNGKVLIAGGLDNLGNALNTAELYDPATGATTPTGNLSDPNGRGGHISVLLPNGKVLLAGGVDNVSAFALTSAELYDPTTGTFSPTGSMMHPRYLAEAALLADGRVLVTGGNNTNTGINTAEIYDPATGLWTPTGNMTQGRIRHNMTLLPNGKVLVTGGRDAAVNFFGLSSAELFDPFANQGVGAFIPIGNMHSVRFVHSSSLLPNGTVLIAGGFDNTFQAVTSAETFDPSTNTFTLTGAMTTPRSRYTSTVLPDGTVLEVGGTNSIQGVTAPAPAEIYSATTGSFVQTGPTTIGRELHRASPLFNGNVLVSGGDDGVNVLSTTEIYYNPVVKEPIVITTTTLPNAFVGQPYVAMALEENSAGPVKWSIVSGALPPGIKGSTIGTYGVAYGTPTTAGSFTFTTQVTDGISTATASFTINVSLATLAFTSNTMPAAGVGRTYSQPLPVTGGTLPYTATQTGGTLPPGLALSTTGLLSGTPSSAGSFTFTVNVTDSSTPVQSATQTLTIAVDTLFITTTALPSGIVGVPYSASISTTGGTLPLTFSSPTAAFPPGLTIQQPAANSASGALAGTPTLAGHYTFTESVVDSSAPAQTATQYYVMDIFAVGTAPVPATVTFLSQPQNSVGGQILGGSPIRVHVTDANNAPIAGASVALSFNGAPPCSTAVLSGTLTAQTGGNGNAVFPDLSIDRGQLGYTLLASAGSASAVSQPFTVNGFCPSANLSTQREVHTQVLLGNGNVLIAGGVDNLGNASNTAELYAPATGTVSPTGNLTDPNGRANQASIVLPNGNVLLAGGFDSISTLSTAELYNPISGTFSATGSMAARREVPTAVLLADGRVLVSGGFLGGATLNTAEIYDPATGLFTPTGNLNQTRGRHTMTLLPNGKVLVTGGWVDASASFGTRASAEIFDPAGNQGMGAFTLIGNMNVSRAFARATLLSNGTVLVVGGFAGGSTGPSLSSAEIFDPATGVFTLTGSMSTTRARHSATALPDGTILVVGGTDSYPGLAARPSAEVYNPANGTFTPTGSMTTGREHLGATLLGNGNVLIGGGDDSTNVLGTTEVYYNTSAVAPLVITTTAVANGFVTQPYVQLLLQQGGLGTLTWALASGTLPPGVTLSSNGILSGSPTAAGTFSFTVKVTDSSATPRTATSGTLTINVILAPLVFTSNAMPTASTGRTYSQPLPLVGGTLPYAATQTGGTLPPGLSLSSNGLLSGTPAAAGVFTFTVSATDSSATPQTATQTLTIAVNTLFITTTALPNGIVGVPYRSPISTSGGTLPIFFSPATTAFPPGLLIQQPVPGSASGALAGTPTTAGTYFFSESVTDSSSPAQTTTQIYSVTILPSGTAVPATVTFLRQPLNSVGGQLLAGTALVVSVTDSTGAPVPNAAVALSFNGAPPCSSAVLGGTLTRFTAANGRASFADLTIDRGQLGYTLLASTGSASAVSQPFTVNGFCGVTTPVYVGSFAANTLLSNGKALITGGIDASGNLSATAQLYDPATRSFTPTGSMQLPRREHTSTLLVDGRVLVTGGRGGTANLSPVTATAEIYDPVAGTFTSTTTPMNAPRRLHTATLLADGTVLLAGGRGTNGDQNTAEIFDPKTNSFVLLTATLATAREFHSATLLPDGTVLVAGGSSSSVGTLNSAEIYNPSTRTFAATQATMNSPRSIFNMLLLSTGQALLIGGDDSTGSIATAELFDPASGSFKSTGSMSSAREFFTANLLPNGQVLAAGGLLANTASSTELATAEVYDSASGTFSQTGYLSSPRAQQTSVTLNDGTVLVTQGGGGSSDEIYYSTAPLAPIAITTTSLTAGVQGRPFTQMLLEQGGVGNLTWTLASGALPPGITLTPGGILIGTPTSGGTFTFAVHLVDSSAPQKSVTSGNFTLTVSAPVNPLVFAPQTLPTAFTGSAYTPSLVASGGTTPYNFAVSSGALPPGINLGTNGTFSGTPTSVGTYSFGVTVTDSSATPQTATQSFTIQVAAPFAITTTALPGGTVNTPYSANISSAGGIAPVGFTVTSGTPPPGLLLTLAPAPPQTATLSGTPTTTGTFTFTVTATDASTPPAIASQSYTVVITPAALLPANVIFVTPPFNSVEGQVLANSPLKILVTDSTNTPIPNASVTIGLTGFNGTPPCAAATLGGTLVQTTDGTGTAMFPNLTINRGQFGFQLAATAGTITALASPINVEGFCDTGSLATARAFHSSVALPNGKVLVAGGTSSGTFTGTFYSSAELYDPSTHSFTGISSMNIPRVDFTMTLLHSGLVLVAGGFNGSIAVSSAELFDPATNTFTLLSSSMVAARYEHVATLLPSGKVLITGGRQTSTSALAGAELFDPATNTFSGTTGPMITPRTFHNAVLLSNGKVLVPGGVDASFNALTSSELYDPVSDAFISTGSMATAREQYAAALLFDGTALVAGGDTGGPGSFTAIATAEIFNPLTGTFSSTGGELQPLVGFTSPVPVLADGSVLVAQGSGPGNVQIYSPAAGTFRATGNMSAAQFDAPTSLLPDGTVLIAGGQVSFPGVTSSAEIFYPVVPLPASVTITTTALFTAIQNKPYTQILLERGGIGTVTWSESGVLPAGMTFSSNGILSGTPTVSGSFPLTFTMTDGPGRSATSGTLTLVVTTPLILGAQTLLTGVTGSAYSTSLAGASGGIPPYSFAVTGGALPPGIALASNGTFSGTPTTTGSFGFTVTATDSALPPQAAQQAFTISVVVPLGFVAATPPNGTVGVTYPATTISVSGGTPPVGFGVTSGTLPPGLTLPSSGPQSATLGGTPTTAGTFTFTVTATDSSRPAMQISQSFTVTIAPAVAPVANITFVSQPQNAIGGQALSINPVWNQLSPTGTPPSGRGFPGASAVYDSASNRLILFGGRDTNGADQNDVWVLTNANGFGGPGQWIQLSPQGGPPLARSGHSAVYDQNSNRMTIFGGCNGSCLPAQNDVWVLTNANGLSGTPTWIQLTPASAPAPRARHTAVYDPNSNAMTIFAGQKSGAGGCNTFADVWVLSHANGLGGAPTWTQLNPAGGPPEGQWAATAVYDPATNRMTTFGGSGAPNTICTTHNSVWALSNANGTGGTPVWTNTVPDGALGSPLGRNFHTAVYDPAVNRMTIFGGSTSGPSLGDTWMLSNANGVGGTPRWTQAAAGVGPAARGAHVAVLDASGANMTVFGGSATAGIVNDTWVLSRANQSGGAVRVLVTDSTNTPIPNANVTMSFNGTPPCAAATLGGTLTQFTDATGTATFANLVIDRGQLGYTLLASAGSISSVSQPFTVNGFCPTGNMSAPREIHTEALLNNGKVLLAGGVNNTTTLSSAELFDPTAGTTSATGNLTAPNGRTGQASVVLSNGQVLLVGGADNAGNPLASAELYDPAVGTFTPTGSMAQARRIVSAVLLADGRVLVGGGANVSGLLSASEIYDPATGAFAATGNLNVPRERHTMTLLPSGTVLVAGGRNFAGAPFNALASAEIFDPIANGGVGAFTSIGNMNAPRDEARAVLLSNGTVLIAGGFVSYQTGLSSATADIFDPATNSFTLSSNSMSVARAHPTATLLPDGTVVVAGGVPDTGTTTPSTTSADIFIPSIGTFAPSGAMSFRREYARDVLLPSGNALVSGGDDGVNTTSSQEIFYSTASLAPITFPFTVLPSATQNQPYTQLLLEQGGVGTLTWTLTANSGPLPTGVTLSSNGILSGTPTQFGGFAFTVQVTDSSVPPKTATITYALLVNPIFQFFGTQLVTALSGVAYNNPLPLIGGTPPYTSTLTAGTLPSGLTFANSAISGTTTALGTYTLSFQAADSSVPPQSTTGTLTLGVTTPLAITTTTLPNGALNSSYSATIATSGGLGNILMGLTANTLPPGLTMSPQGAISGTPTQTGTFNFTVAAFDQSFPPQTATQAESITITTAVAPISLSPNPLNLLANNTGNMTVTLSSAAGPNGQTVTLGSSNSSVASVPPSVNVLANNTSATFQVTAGATANTATITASAPGSTSGNASVIVTTRPMALTTDGPLLAVNRSFNATVTLAQPVPTGSSVTVALSANPTGVVSISPATQTILAGQTTAVFSLTAGPSAGGTLLTATASGYTNATAPLTVTSAVISLQGVTVAPGQSNSLPVSLSQPAPAGGLTITLTSSAPGTATVTPTVFVPAGAQTPSANPQVTGLLIGPANVTAAAIGFAPDTAAVNVTVTASFSPTTVFVISNGATATATLNISAPAPQGGITFNLATGSTGTATVPAQATVIQGATSVQFLVTGVAAGSTSLTANSTGIAQATATINVTQAPQISIGSTSVGQNLEVALNVFLGAIAPAGGVTVTIASTDPTKVLLSATGKDAGSGSLQINVSAANSFVGTIYFYALQASGSVPVTASAPGYTTGTGTITMQPSGFIINFPGAINTTTFSGPTSVQVTPAVLSPGTLNWAGNQGLRGGFGPVSVPVSLGSSSVGTLTPATLTFNPGDSSQLASFQPSAAGGNTTISLGAQPVGFSTPANFQQISVSVNPPVISFPNLTIGNNLQSIGNLFLGATPPSPVTVTLTTNSTNLLLSKTGTDAGSGTLTFTNVTSTFVGTIFVYALQSTGTAPITISAPGYATANPTITMQPSGFIINFPGAINTTTFSGPTSVQVTPAILSPGTLNWAGNQSLRGGVGPLSVPVSLGSTAVGTLTPATLTFNGGDSSQLTSFQPSTTGGTTTLNLGAQPVGFSAPANFQQIPVSVTAPIISFGNLSIGNNLQNLGNVFLGATPPNPVTVTLTANSANLLLSKTGTDSGSGTLTFTNVTSTFAGTVFVYALQSTGTATITITAPGYATATATVTMQPSGFIINFPGAINTTTFSGPSSVQVTPAILSPGTLNWAGNQSLRGGIGPVNIAVSLGSGGPVGTLMPGTLTFNGGDNSQIASFQPTSAGNTTLSLGAQPPGFSTPANFQQIPVSVTAPAISVPSSANVGLNLQTSLNVFLQNAPPNPVTVTVTSPNAAIVAVTSDPTVVGGATATFPNVTSTFVGTLTIQGFSLNSTQIKLQAAGYTDAFISVTVNPSGFIVNSPGSFTTTVGSSTPLQITPAVLTPSLLTWNGNQTLRAGMTVSLNVTSSNTAAGTISASPLTFPGNASFVTTSFQAVAPGSSTITVVPPPGFSTPSNFQQITATVQ